MYKIVLHEKVSSEDLKGLDKSSVCRLLKAVKEKLETHPLDFGKPLRRKLKGYYRLRVEFYRIIYKIKRQEVVVSVVKIGKRKDNEVYNDVLKRLRSIS